MIEKIHTTRCGEIHYWITERIGNDKPTLLFLPGLTADHRLFEKQIEYWDCFYRDQCYKYNEYIGKKLYDECFGYTRKYEKYYDKSLLTSYQPKKPADYMPPWSR